MVKSTAFEYGVLLIIKNIISIISNNKTELNESDFVLSVKFKSKAFPLRVAGQEGSLKVCKQPTAVIFLQQPTIEL